MLSTVTLMLSTVTLMLSTVTLMLSTVTLMLSTVTLMLSTLHRNERRGPPVTHCRLLSSSAPQLLSASLPATRDLLRLEESDTFKSTAPRVKPMIVLQIQAAITCCFVSGSAESVKGSPPPPCTQTHTNTHVHTGADKSIHTHIWSIFVPMLQS